MTIRRLHTSLLATAALWLTVPAAGWADEAQSPVAVTIGAKSCDPMQLHVPAGTVVFKIRNDSKRAVEWEILKGTMVVEERENILPGFTSTLTAKLAPDTYEMTCGLVSNPKGQLVVAPGALPREAVNPTAPKLGEVIARYKAYVATEAAELVAKTQVLVDAVKAGDLEAARRAYAPAHLHYERIEPVAEAFNDLDKTMDSRADDYEHKEADPNFSGYHRIEYGLFAKGSLAGLAPYADRLMRDARDLQSRVAKLDITPKILIDGSAELLEEVASKKISGEEDRYSRTDLWDFQANLDGAQKIVSLLRPDLGARDPALLARIEANFAKVDKGLARYRSGDGFKSYDAVSTQDQKALKGPVTVLAEDLSKLRGTLGVD